MFDVGEEALFSFADPTLIPGVNGLPEQEARSARSRKDILNLVTGKQGVGDTLASLATTAQERPLVQQLGRGAIGVTGAASIAKNAPKIVRAVAQVAGVGADVARAGGNVVPALPRDGTARAIVGANEDATKAALHTEGVKVLAAKIKKGDVLAPYDRASADLFD